MAWFWTIIQLLIRLSAFFGICGMIMLHGIWYKLEEWIKRYLIQTYHRLSQEYFRSYRIAFRVALWLDFEQLSSYLFISRCLFRAAIYKCYMEFDTKLEDWIKRYLIQTHHRLSQEYFKSYRIAFKVALWLDFEQLSSYLFISRCLFRAAISKCYMEFDTKLEDWIKRYLIQTYHRLSQEYFKSYRIAFRVVLWLDFEQLSSYLFVYRHYFWSCGTIMIHGIWYQLEEWIKRYLIQTYHRLSQEYFKSYRIAFKVALWLDFEQLSSYLFISRCFFELRYQNVTWNLIQNWRIESRDILFKLTTGYLKSISSQIE